jgi:uncharacterized protein YbjT (DUF2867 family)
MSETVLVYGATGTQGEPVARRLLDQGAHVRALVRDEGRARWLHDAGAEIVLGDLADPVSLEVASKGADRVVLQLPLQYDFGLHQTYGLNAVDAARAAGVDLVVFNTSAHILAADVEVYRVRQTVVDALQASGVPSIVLRPTFYLDNFLGPWIRPGIDNDGILAFPLPSSFEMSWISADDAAAFAVAALDRPDLAGRVLDIGGAEPLTGDNIARCLSAALGRTIRYAPITPDDYERALVPGFGAAVAAEVAEQVRCIVAQGTGALDMDATYREFGVEPVQLIRWIESHWPR